MKASLSVSRRQRGLTLVSLLLICIVIGFTSLVVMRVVPTFIEYQNIKKALVRAVSSSGNNNPEAIRSAFDRSQAIDDFSAISSKDLKIEKGAGCLLYTSDAAEQLQVSFKYEKRIPLFGPASLVIDYEGDARAR